MVAKAVQLTQCSRMNRLFLSVVAVLFAAFALITQPSAQADTFGTSGNEFTIDFVDIGNADNAADTTGYGAVPYEYRASTHEISQNAITKATASGMANVVAGAWTGNQPAADIDWYEAAAFVNFLNTSSGKTVAYDLTLSNGSWSMALWSSADAWQLGGENLYRNKDAFYFLPSENEWYKAAYYNAAGTNYFLYPTASSSVPTAVANGTNAGTAVYRSVASVPATVADAGGLSPYGTMAQGGNVWEWNESAFDGTNNSSTEDRLIRASSWASSDNPMRSSSSRGSFGPTYEFDTFGLRVASVPEPSTYALLLMTAAGALWFTRKRRPIKVRALIPVVAVLFAVFTLISNLQAQPVVNIETLVYGNYGADGTIFRDTIGYSFTVKDSPLSVTKLGVFDYQTNGLSKTNFVGLWDNNGALLASVTIGRGTSAPLIGAFRWVALHVPLTLDALSTYRIGAMADGGEVYYSGIIPEGQFSGTSETTNVLFNGTVRNNSLDTFSYPRSTPSAGSAVIGPNATFDVVPEPSTYALLVMTTAGALWFTRKRRPIKVRALIPVVAALFAAFTLISNLQAQPLVNIETIRVGDAGNEGDTVVAIWHGTAGYGAVAYDFSIGKYEVTIGQYTIFLNSVAAVTSSPHLLNLWNPLMAADLNIAGISRSGFGTDEHPFVYSVVGPSGITPLGASNPDNRPVAYVSWFDAARFVNWLHNGATNGASTEIGAYTLNGATTGIITKTPEATWWIPSEDEWYKAAYYKGGGTTSGYWIYPTQSDVAPSNKIGGQLNQANHFAGDYSVTQLPNYDAYDVNQNHLTEVGAFTDSQSFYGTYDQGGSLWEWSDGVIGDLRSIRGGSWTDPSGLLMSEHRQNGDPSTDSYEVGFRIATVAPTLSVVITVEKTTGLSGQWQFDREINVGPVTNTSEFYRLKIRTEVD